MNSTGKAVRHQYGNRYAAKGAKRHKTDRTFGKLPVSVSRGNAQAFVLEHAGAWAWEADQEAEREKECEKEKRRRKFSHGDSGRVFGSMSGTNG